MDCNILIVVLFIATGLFTCLNVLLSEELPYSTFPSCLESLQIVQYLMVILYFTYRNKMN